MPKTRLYALFRCRSCCGLSKRKFYKKRERYDFIFDLVAHQSVFAYQRALKPAGTYFMVGGAVRTLFQLLLLGPIFKDKQIKHSAYWQFRKLEKTYFLLQSSVKMARSELLLIKHFLLVKFQPHCNT